MGRILTPATEPPPKLNGFVEPLPFDQNYDYSYDGIMRSFEDSVQRLGLNRVDILFVHDIGTRTHGNNHDLYLDQLRESGFRALEDLKRSGAISAIGIGVNEVEVCEEILSFQPLDLILLAGRYTLLDRSAEARLLELCRVASTQLVIGGVFNSGILATGARHGAHWDYGPAPEAILKKVSALAELSEAFSVSLPTAALVFPLRHDAVSTVLLGNSHSSRLAENAAAIQSGNIPPEFWVQASAIAYSTGSGSISD